LVTSDRSDGHAPARQGPLQRAVSLWRVGRARTQRYRLLTDVVGALVIVGVVLAALAAATGGAWPPVLVVESGSMMHASTDTHYGRLGSIDPGDVLLVRPFTGTVHTWAEGGPEHYGRPGEVIVYAPNGDRANLTTPRIIHRAMAFVEVDRARDDGLRYHLRWIDGKVLDFGPEGIYFPPLGFDEGAGFSPRAGFRPAYSGYVTKGDNAFLNPVSDQAGGISALVDPNWIEGRAVGELPWMGLGQLALQPRTNPYVAGWVRVGNAFAPLELWSCFWIVVALVVLVPLSVDTWRWHQRAQAERRRDAELLERNRVAREARAKALEADRARRAVLPPSIVAPIAPPPPKPKKRADAVTTDVTTPRDSKHDTARGSPRAMVRVVTRAHRKPGRTMC
jgi:signal peptidase